MKLGWGKGDNKKLGLNKEQAKFEKEDVEEVEERAKERGRASKGICCCDKNVVIWEFSFFSATKQDRVGPSLLSRSTVFSFCS